MAKCEFCDKGVTFGIKVSHSHRAFQPYMEAQREACEGDRQRFPPPCVCLYPVYAFR